MESFQDIEHFVKTLSAAIKKKIPTKVSQLTNDVGYKTTDTNTTYKLSKSGSTVTLTGSDGSTTSVTDSNTTYSSLKNPYSLDIQNNGTTVASYDGSTAKTANFTNATSSADGLMSKADKAKLDGIPSSAGSNVVATESTDGLMSAADKAKLDGITGQVTADKANAPDHITDLVQYGAFEIAVQQIISQIPIDDIISEATIFFISSDVEDGSATAWTSVPALASGENHNAILGKVSQMFKNVRYLFKMLGTTDISKIGDGTVAGAIASLNADLAKLYPVGSIYLSTNSTNPASLFGGTWEQIKDRFLLASGDTYSAGSTGGEAQHKLTVDEMPSHAHNFDNYISGYPPYSLGRDDKDNYTMPLVNTLNPDDTMGAGQYTNAAGNSKPHNNMPPYLVVYMWKRVS